MKNLVTIALFVMLRMTAAWAAPDDRGIILSVKGSAEVVSLSETASATQFRFVKRGERIKVNDGGQVVMTFYPTKTFYEIIGPATLELGDESIVAVSGKAPTARPMQDAQVRAASITQSETRRVGAVIFRGPKDSMVDLLEPVPFSAVLPDKPTFVWSSALPAPYEIVVVDAKTATEIVRESVAGTRWTLRGGLKGGETYLWRVSAGAVNSPERAFFVASEKDHQEIERVRPLATDDKESWLLFAAVLQGKGLEGEARAALNFIRYKWPEAELR